MFRIFLWFYFDNMVFLGRVGRRFVIMLNGKVKNINVVFIYFCYREYERKDNL